jgi:hypothetical protein
MIVEAILSVIKFIVQGIINLLPTAPSVSISYLDGVFMALSMTDLLINVKVLGVCICVLFVVTNARLIFGVIMWVVRKIPFLK